MKFVVKWLGIDSDMLKLSEKIMNDFWGGDDLQYLEPSLKLAPFTISWTECISQAKIEKLVIY